MTVKFNNNNSNLGFILVGLYIFLFSSWFIGFCVILMGAASWYSHTYGDFEADWEGMWICFWMIAAQEFNNFLIGLAGLFLTITFLEDFLKRMPKVLGLRPHYLLLGAVYLLGAVGSFYTTPWYLALGSIILFAVGFYVRQSDIPNGHAWWHILIANALLIRYL